MSTVYEFDDKFKHEVILQVPLFMTDYGDGIYHGRYLDLYQQARDAFYADAGYPYKNFMAQHYYILIVDLHVTYKKAVSIYDDVMIRTRISGMRDKSFDMVQEMWRREGDGEVFCNRLELTHVCVTGERKAVPLPDFFREKIVAFQNCTQG